MSADAVATKQVDRGYLRARLGSLLGILPLGIWTVGHLWNNLAAFQSPEDWQKSVTEYRHPISFFLTSLVALLPLALHTIWGIGRIFSMKPNGYPTLNNARYWLQRLSAIGLLLFLGAHIYKAMIEPRMAGGPEQFSHIASMMAHHPPTLIVYILGMLGIAYHLANGIHTFCMGWGVVSSQAALRKLQILIWILFAALLASGWGIVYRLWDAGHAY